MQNSVVVLAFFDFTQEIHFLSKSGSQKQNCQFKLEIPLLIGICEIKCSCLLFPISTGKTLFFGYLVSKFKIGSLC